MQKSSRRKFMALGATLVGAGVAREEVTKELDKRQGEPEPSLDVHDISISDISLNIYKLNENDWNAKVSIRVSNEHRRKYAVQIPVYIVDEDGHRLDEVKTFIFKLPESGHFTGTKKWKKPNSAVRTGEDVVVKHVRVTEPRLLRNHEDVTNNPEEVIKNEN